MTDQNQQQQQQAAQGGDQNNQQGAQGGAQAGQDPAAGQGSAQGAGTDGGGAAQGNAGTGGQQQGDGAQGAQPITYELQLPEGSVLGDDFKGQVEEFAKANNLSNEAANEALKMVDGKYRAMKEAETKTVQEFMAKWPDEIKADQEYGGEQVEANVDLAMSVIKRFASDGFYDVLEQTGYGNHPELVRIFYRIGKAMSPDELVTSGEGGDDGGEKTHAQKLYG